MVLGTLTLSMMMMTAIVFRRTDSYWTCSDDPQRDHVTAEGVMKWMSKFILIDILRCEIGVSFSLST